MSIAKSTANNVTNVQRAGHSPKSFQTTAAVTMIAGGTYLKAMTWKFRIASSSQRADETTHETSVFVNEKGSRRASRFSFLDSRHLRFTTDEKLHCDEGPVLHERQSSRAMRLFDFNSPNGLRIGLTISKAVLIFGKMPSGNRHGEWRRHEAPAGAQAGGRAPAG
jgi:hypothetical protein